MRAMILAAGYGERMRPLTHTVPKPTVPVLGRPMILQILSRLVRDGVTHAAMNLHHLPERVRAVVGDGSAVGIESIRFTFEPEILGTGGGIRNAAPHLRGDGTVLVRNADFLADIDVRSALASHRASGRLATLVLIPRRPGYTPVHVATDGRVVAIGGEERGEGSASYVFTGCHFLEEAVLDRIPTEGPSDIIRDVYLALMRDGALGYVLHPGFWWEFGSPGEYLAGSLRLLRSSQALRAAVGGTDPVRRIGSGRLAVGPGVELEPATLRGGVALGLATHVSEGATLEDTIVMPEAWIGPRVSLTRAVVAPGTEIPADFRAEDALICPDPGEAIPLPDSAERVEGLVVRPLHGGRR